MSKSFKVEKPIEVKCINEPNRFAGLEGFKKGNKYKAQEVSAPVRYWRVWLKPSGKYYKVWSLNGFTAYFKA